MKVHELIDELSMIDRNLDVVFNLELTEETPTSLGVNVLELDGVASVHAQRIRPNDRAGLIFGKSELSELLAVLNVTNDI